MAKKPEKQAALTVQNATLSEDGGSMIFTVALNPASNSRPVTVSYATANGTATAGTDYTAASGTLTFRPGQKAAQVVVPITSDSIDESNETILLNLFNAKGATIADAQDVGTIEDDDGTPLFVDFEDAPRSDMSSYEGFNWAVPTTSGRFVTDGNLDVFDPAPGDGGYDAVGSGKVALTPFSAEPVTITRVDGADFIFDKGSLASAHHESMTIEATGYNDGAVVGTETFTVSKNSATVFDPSWGLIDELEFDVVAYSTDEGLPPSSEHLAFDNLYFVV